MPIQPQPQPPTSIPASARSMFLQHAQQRFQQQQGPGDGMPNQPLDAAAAHIRDVYADNLHREFTAISSLVQHFPYVAMDTEFPGVVARPVGDFSGASDYIYQTLRANVDILRIIQIGLSLSDAEGRRPKGVSTWQFNFRFSMAEDMYAQDSIDLLGKSGIDFRELAMRGVDPADFGELLIASGLVLAPDVHWVSFHSSYDFGYLLKLLTCSPLPQTDIDFLRLLKIYFPRIYDVKHLMTMCPKLKGGLQELADDLGVARIGPQHQAGSDALLTLLAYFKLREAYFSGTFSDTDHMGRLYGLISLKEVDAEQT